ncbi:putative adhesion G protein-coupled receptor E4P [Anneissia japonica]|uniref:putative adhesion G protein-coupled receptor E4P n=1 Tax=Anneissia japonica TaxID=1529436 RepID=UPI001425638C|nr:putative adhesion G protein-coupled receptor E4P [Anneissia japonica]
MTPHNDYENCNDLELNVDMVNIEKMNESVTVSDENKTFTISESDYRVEMTFNIESEPAKPIRVSISNCLDHSPDPTCPLIALNINDFEVIENKIWVYKPNGRQFTIDEIAIFSNDSVYVCSFFSQNGTHTYVSTIFIYDKTLQILNVVGVSCSLLGLFLTFIIRCIKKDLRTISGKIVMNIAAALFLAQLGTLLAKTLVESKLGCVALAALLHYLWLVAFMWMFIMSTVLFKSFRSLKSAVEHRSGKQSITMPFFCCWGLPVLVVAVAMTFHIWEYAPIKFSYGDKTVCWIRDEFAAFLFLGIPMATILALNSIMFVVIVCGIYQTKTSSKTMRGASTKKDISTNLIVFAKISCIMGLTWIFGFLASFLDEPFLCCFSNPTPLNIDWSDTNVRVGDNNQVNAINFTPDIVYKAIGNRETKAMLLDPI